MIMHTEQQLQDQDGCQYGDQFLPTVLFTKPVAWKGEANLG